MQSLTRCHDDQISFFVVTPDIADLFAVNCKTNFMNKNKIYHICTFIILTIVINSCTSEQSDSKIGQTYSYDTVRLGECAFYLFTGTEYERQEDPQIVNLVDSIRPEYTNYLDSIYTNGLVMDLPDYLEFISETEIRIYGMDINNDEFDFTFDYFYNDNGELEINTLNTMFHCEGNELVGKLFSTRTRFQRSVFQGETDFRKYDDIDLLMSKLTTESFYGNATTGDFVLMCLNDMVYSAN